MSSLPESGIRQVAVVGAGPSGLATTKYLIAEGCFEKIDVYEQQATVEGVWNMTLPEEATAITVPQTTSFQSLPQPKWNQSVAGTLCPQFTTPMYDNLETNIPYHLMQFSDLLFPEGTQLFPTRHNVSQYLKKYALDVDHLIKFETQVIEISLQPGKGDRWLLKSKTLRTGEISQRTYDAIAICSGHYDVPYIPSYPGIKEWNEAYPGVVSHTKTYRNADAFRDKKVLIVGNAASGTDIASQVSKVSRRPLLVSQRSESFLSVPGKIHSEALVQPVGQISEFVAFPEGDRAIHFVDGTTAKDFDSVLFATGYLYDFPFFKKPELDVIDDGMRIKRVYQHLFHIDHPSLVFLGLPIRISPFPVSEAQAAIVARVWGGRLNLPAREIMVEWERETLEENGEGRAFHNLTFPKDYHYQRMLCDWASQAIPSHGKLPHSWSHKEAWIRERSPAIKRAFADKGDERHKVSTLEELGFNYGEQKREEEEACRQT